MPKRFLKRNDTRRKGWLPELPAFKTSIVLVAAAALFGVGYIVQVSADATKGYQIRSLQGQIADLKDQQEKAELQVAANQAVKAVEDKVKELGMVPTSRVEYLTDAPPAVAVR